METRRHLDAIRLESSRFSRAVRGPLDARVPSCPDWSLGDLVWHLGGVQWFWSEVVRRRATDRDGIEEPRVMPDDRLPTWFDGVSEGLIGALASLDPGTRVWSWAGGQQDVGCSGRRTCRASTARWACIWLRPRARRRGS